jgi:drug/metabolite transporter (DMT)-like permease
LIGEGDTPILGRPVLGHPVFAMPPEGFNDFNGVRLERVGWFSTRSDFLPVGPTRARGRSSRPSPSLGAAGAMLIAAVGYAAGPMILKRHLTHLDPRAAMGASLAVAAIVLTPLAVFDAPTRAPTAGALGAVVVLGLLCAAVAFVLMATLIGEIGPGRAVVITYVNLPAS